MRLLKLFSKSKSGLMRLPSGSFTVGRKGEILASTLPQWFPLELVDTIAAKVLQAFKSSHTAQLPLSELIVHYPSLKITARELHGGALIFLSPQTLNSPVRNSLTLTAYAR
jgi:hypothetical protein